MFSEVYYFKVYCFSNKYSFYLYTKVNFFFTMETASVFISATVVIIPFVGFKLY